MKGTSKVIMGATLLMVVTLAIVLGLVMVLLVELYCSFLLRRRKEIQTTTSADIPNGNANNSSQQPQNQLEISSLSNFGVLRAPRSFLFPAVSGKENMDIEKRNPPPPQISESRTQKPISTSHQFKILYASPPSPPLISMTSSQPLRKVLIQGNDEASTSSNGVCGDCKENLVYISNPMYDNEEASQQSRVDTPFGTPDSSPSRLEMGGSSSDDDDITSVPITPPLSPMKKLPAEACSVSLRDARSPATSGSNSNSNNGLSSLSSSGSPSTSPSW